MLMNYATHLNKCAKPLPASAQASHDTSHEGGPILWRSVAGRKISCPK